MSSRPVVGGRTINPSVAIYTMPANLKPRSAGLLIFRIRERNSEVLVHPGGPYWALKDEGAWSIPKGLVEENAAKLTGSNSERDDPPAMPIRRCPPHRCRVGRAIGRGSERRCRQARNECCGLEQALEDFACTYWLFFIRMRT